MEEHADLFKRVPALKMKVSTLVIGLLFVSMPLSCVTAEKRNNDRPFASWAKASSGLPTSGTYYGVAFGDINNDGNMDVVGATDGDGVRVYLGDGKGNWTTVAKHPVTTGGFSDVKVGDLDSDGNKDIIVGSPGSGSTTPEGLHLFKGDGAGGFTDVTSGSNLPNAGVWRGVYLDDVNKDGRLDIATSSGSAGIHVFTNDGKMKFTDNSSGLPNNEARESGIVLADFSNDGNLDLSTAGSPGASVYLGNGGSGGSMKWTESSNGLPNYGGFTGVDATDMNKDGSFDIVLSAYGAGSGIGINAYRSVNKAASWASSSSGLPSSGDYCDLSAGDFDSDGNADLFSAGIRSASGIHVYKGDGSGNWTEESSGLPTSGGYVGTDVGDMSNDGKLDLLVGNEGGGLEVYMNTQSGLPAPFVVNTNPPNGATNVPITTDIAVTFSLTMNRTATEGAISANPSITGTFSWDIASRTVTWNPSPDLQAGTKYWINISTAAKSQGGIKLPSQYTFSFTIAGGTPTPPTVTNTNPTNGANNVPMTTTIAITFSKAMNKSATEPAVTVSPAIIWTPAWTSGDTIATFTPSANLQAGTQYTITISTAAKSADGGNMASQYQFSFTTASGPVPPTVTSTNPANNSNNIPVNTKIAITFSVAMDKTVTETAITANPSITGTFAWDVASKVVTWSPSASLQTNTKHTVTISKAAKSQAGTNMANPHVFSFTTAVGGGGDTWAPIVSSTNPTNGATNIDKTTIVSITFNESMDKTATNGAVSINPGSISSPVWSNGDKTVTFSTTLTNGTTYTVTVSTSARDIAGNPMASVYTFSFTTKTGGGSGDTTPPTVLSTNPQNNAKDVDKTTKVTITFSEAMGKTATESSVTVSPGTITNKTWSDDASLILTIDITDGQTYTVTVSTGAKDQAGNQMAALYIFSFTTKAATPPPTEDKILGLEVSTFSLLLVIIIVIVMIAIVIAILMKRKKKAEPQAPPIEGYSFYGQQQYDQQQYGQQPPTL